MGSLVKQVQTVWYSQLGDNTYRFNLVNFWCRAGDIFRLYALSGNEEAGDSPFKMEPYNVLAFNINDNALNLSGMHIKLSERGTWISDILFYQSLKIAEILGKEKIQTSKMKKPLLAAKFNSWWFTPEKWETFAHILEVDDDGIPIIDFYSKRPSETPVTTSKNWQWVFYKVRKRKLWTPDRQIRVRSCPVIQEKYFLDDLGNIDREKICGKITWKSRLYPKRVEQVLAA